MRMTTRGIVAVIASAAFVSFISLQVVSAQAPAGQAPGAQAPAGQQPPGAKPPQAPAPGASQAKPQEAKGELKSVDTAKMTLTLANGQTFQYNTATKVTGAQGGVAGLASMSGREVIVEYETKGADRIATMIEVAAEKK